MVQDELGPATTFPPLTAEKSEIARRLSQLSQEGQAMGSSASAIILLFSNLAPHSRQMYSYMGMARVFYYEMGVASKWPRSGVFCSEHHLGLSQRVAQPS